MNKVPICLAVWAALTSAPGASIADTTGVASDAELNAIPLRKPAKIEFTDYPAVRYAGPVTPPDFRARQKRFRRFRTAIREGIADGVNFGGRYALITVGCGTGCSASWLADLRTGQIHVVLGGGEQRSYQDQAFKPDSMILKQRWPAASSKGTPVYCVTQTYRWTGLAFVSVDEAKERADAQEVLAADCSFPQ